MSFKIKQFLLHVFLPIVLGTIIYIAFRSKTIRLFDWFERIGIAESIYGFRSIIIPYKKDIPNWIYYSLPDGLWVYAFSSSLLIYWNKKKEKTKYSLHILFVLVTSFEMAQGLKLVKGTFDFLDLVFTLLALILSVTINNYNLKQNGEKLFEI